MSENDKLLSIRQVSEICTVSARKIWRDVSARPVEGLRISVNFMIVFKHKRRVSGKVIVSRFYSGRYRLAEDTKPTTVALHTTDKQVAEAKLKQIVSELEHERAGLLAPKAIREGLQKLVAELVAEYLAERRQVGRNEKYVKGLQLQFSTIADCCEWRIVRDISADSFRAWRQKQKGVEPVTLNKYLSAVSSLLAWLECSERIPRNPLKSVEKLLESGEPTYQRKALTLEQIRALLCLAGRRRALYATALKTGLRRGGTREAGMAGCSDRRRRFVLERAAFNDQ